MAEEELEIKLAATLQKILTQPELCEWQKANQSNDAIAACLKQSQDEGKRLFFALPGALKKSHWMRFATQLPSRKHTIVISLNVNNRHWGVG
jgi:hypothetical protein